MNKPLLVLLSILMAASLLLVGCGTAPTTAPATSAPATTAPAVKITIWHQWEGAYLDPITAAFTQYGTDHPNVTFDLTKPNDVQASLKVAVPAGEGPDIIGWANDHIGDLALAGYIVPLDDLGITQDWLESTYGPAAAAGVIWNGKIWGLPESQEALAFIYNKAIVSDEYLPKDPLNLDDIAAKAQKYYEDKGMPLFCNQGLKGGDAYNVAPFYFAAGVPTYVDDTGKVYLNTPEAVKGAQWVLDLEPYMLKDADYNACKAAFVEGKVGAWNTGPWAIADIEAAKIDYGILPLGKPFVGIKTLMISKNAVDRGTAEVALDVIKYYTAKDAQVKVSLANKTIPANAEALKDPQVAALPTLAGFGAATALGVPMPSTPYMSAVWTPLGDATSAIWNGSQTPAEALAAAQKAIEDAIAQMQ
ncbi:MAG: extracellular solute-binding protein [Chloroflexi bacterium]|nr:extracellular solute-binding protein [Chloroflexota bacterium]